MAIALYVDVHVHRAITDGLRRRGVDVLRILFNDRPVHEGDEEKPGLIFDYDAQGHLVGIEMLDASEHVENPSAVDFAEVASATTD